jgi:NitT/TauT family transport system ATP-binding protein
VAIARALIRRPEVLLMDEPFSAVDAMTRALLQDLLLRIWRSRPITILFVTHDVDEAVLLSERVLCLGRGGAGLCEDVPIRLPQPRDQIDTRAHPDFIALRQRLFASIFRQETTGGPH